MSLETYYSFLRVVGILCTAALIIGALSGKDED